MLEKSIQHLIKSENAKNNILPFTEKITTVKMRKAINEGLNKIFGEQDSIEDYENVYKSDDSELDPSTEFLETAQDLESSVDRLLEYKLNQYRNETHSILANNIVPLKRKPKNRKL
jgi:hypothetical protein